MSVDVVVVLEELAHNSYSRGTISGLDVWSANCHATVVTYFDTGSIESPTNPSTQVNWRIGAQEHTDLDDANVNHSVLSEQPSLD